MYMWTRQNMYMYKVIEDTRTPSLENWDGGLKSVLRLANSPHTSKYPRALFVPSIHVHVVHVFVACWLSSVVTSNMFTHCREGVALVDIGCGPW